MAKNYSALHNKVISRPGAPQRLSELREQSLAEIGLHALREGTGMTQTELALVLEVSQSAISQLERGHRDVKVSTLEAYVNALGADLELTAVFKAGQPDETKTPIQLKAPTA